MAILMLLQASKFFDSSMEQAAVLSRNEPDCVQELAELAENEVKWAGSGKLYGIIRGRCSILRSSFIM